MPMESTWSDNFSSFILLDSRSDFQSVPFFEKIVELSIRRGRSMFLWKVEKVLYGSKYEEGECHPTHKVRDSRGCGQYAENVFNNEASESSKRTGVEQGMGVYTTFSAL
jgi:hypothetical protein